MLGWTTIDVADNERALVFKNKQFDQILSSGRYHLWSLNQDLRVERFDLTQVVFDYPQAKWLMHQYSQALANDIETVELTDDELGLEYRDGRLTDLLLPGSFRAYWKGVEAVEVKRINVTDTLAIEDDALLAALGRGANPTLVRTLAQAVMYMEVPDQHLGLLYLNGKLADRLEPGSYGYWKYRRNIRINLVDLRLQTMDVSGQEILTKDRVSLRLNLSATYKVVDIDKAIQAVKDVEDLVYRELQLLLRQSVGTRLLDELLRDKDALNIAIADEAKTQLETYGIRLVGVGVKDIILPGDMKHILNQVVEAEKQAEANIVKRREETQAMRSLQNTAKVMENNPVLMRLKELEALERITEKISSISVYNGLEGVMDMVKLTPQPSARKA